MDFWKVLFLNLKQVYILQPLGLCAFCKPGNHGSLINCVVKNYFFTTLATGMSLLIPMEVLMM